MLDRRRCGSSRAPRRSRGASQAETERPAMMVALLLAAAGAGAASFKAAFPQASVTEAPAIGTLTSASGFEAHGLGKTPEEAARAFLDRYGAAFGVGSAQELSVL